MLEVVQYQQELSGCDRPCQLRERLSLAEGDVQGMGDGVRELVCGREGFERHETDPILEDVVALLLEGGLQRQARLADAAGAGERKESTLLTREQRGDVAKLRVAPHEGGRWVGEGMQDAADPLQLDSGFFVGERESQA